MTYRVLDLFCCAGGAAMGYHLAWPDAEIVGVDISPQPRYPFTFVQADAMVYPLDGFDFVHASPVCKAHTKTGWAYHFGYHANHADLITPTRDLLASWGGPWVIENVPGAPMRPDLVLCGSMFDLGVRRHRWFESNRPLPPWVLSCNHSRRVVSPHGNPNRFKGSAKQWAEAMGIDWMTGPELAQAIPPAYTRYLAEQLRPIADAA